MTRGNAIAINPYMMHHHPDFWKDPEAYNPDRFAEDEAKRMHKFVYFPFGGGPRICIGKDLRFRACSETDSRSCRREKVVMPPIRQGSAALTR